MGGFRDDWGSDDNSRNSRGERRDGLNESTTPGLDSQSLGIPQAQRDEDLRRDLSISFFKRLSIFMFHTPF
jgi:hypothetical protein